MVSLLKSQQERRIFTMMWRTLGLSVCALCAIRIGEITGMKWMCFHPGQIHVHVNFAPILVRSCVCGFCFVLLYAKPLLLFSKLN